MRQLFIFLIILIATNVYGQSFEERAAILTCDCLKKQKKIDDVKYRECLSNSLTEVIAKNGNPDDLSKIETIEGMQNTLSKVDSIVSLTCVLLSEKELEEKRKIFYSDSKNKSVQNSFIIGNDMMRDKEYDIAIENYNFALSEDSTFVPALDNMAACYKQLGDFENAIKYYNKSLSIYPEGEFALMNIGVIYTKLSEFEISNKYYMRLTQLYPNNPEGYYGLGKNYILLGKFEKGLENISIAHKIYKETKSDYVQDTEKVIEIVRQMMKKTNQEEEFYKLAKKYGLETK